MIRKAALFAVAMTVASAASAQVRLPVIVPLRNPAQSPASPRMGVNALRGDFVAKSGSDLVYFSGDSVVLSAQAKATLAAQAMWLRQHPEVTVRIEGHAELSDTRDYALAVGARRAQEVRDYLILMGVPPVQVTATTWGKERPGPARAVTVLVR